MMNSDNAQALYESGVYLEQQANPPDFAGAYQRYARAAEMGHVAAIHNLAYLYLNGEGVKRDPDTALALFQKAAATGAPEEQYELAALLSGGRFDRAPDQENAVYWYRRAAEQGFPRALHNLAWAYLQGVGVERDPDTALALFQKAAATGVPEEQYELAVLLSEGRFDRAPDHESAVYWYRRAAEQGFPSALHNLAWDYLEGVGVERDPDTALALFQKAAATGVPKEQYELAVLLSEGRFDHAPDHENAVYWYRRAAEQGFPQALHNLAWCYLQGVGVERNPGIALDLFQKAAAAGLPQSGAVAEKLKNHS